MVVNLRLCWCLYRTKWKNKQSLKVGICAGGEMIVLEGLDGKLQKYLKPTECKIILSVQSQEKTTTNTGIGEIPARNIHIVATDDNDIFNWRNQCYDENVGDFHFKRISTFLWLALGLCMYFVSSCVCLLTIYTIEMLRCVENLVSNVP